MKFLTALSFMLLFVCPVESAEMQMFPSLRKHLRQQHASRDDRDIAAAEAKSIAIDIASDVPAASVDIPAPTSAGLDGFLPDVANMTGGASKTLTDLNSQAVALQAKLADTQHTLMSRLAKRKKLFERKLNMQEEDNTNVTAVNSKIESDIQYVKKGNEEFRNTARVLQEENRQMRDELRVLDNKFGEVKSFITESLSDTDDSKAKELLVLGGRHMHRAMNQKQLSLLTTEAMHEDNDDQDDDGEESDDSSDGSADSFLSVSMKRSMELGEKTDGAEVPVGDANGLVDVLRHGVEQLAKEGRDSEERLHTLFVSKFQAGSKRHKALLRKQNALLGERSSLEKLRDQLSAAVTHLRHTNSNLSRRLHGMGHFVQKLSHIALAPAKEVSHLIDALPLIVKADDKPSEKAK